MVILPNPDGTKPIKYIAQSSIRREYEMAGDIGSAKESELYAQLARLDEAVKIAVDRAALLIGRIEPILTPVPTLLSTSDKAGPEKPMSVIGARIQKVRKDVEDLTDRINSALNSLEL